MKKYIIAFFILFTAFTYSQSEADYKNNLNSIKKGFNEKKVSLIYEKFSSDLKNQYTEPGLKKMMDSLSTEKGNISSFDFLVDYEKGKNFLLQFENNSMLLFIDLTHDNQIQSFEIKDY